MGLKTFDVEIVSPVSASRMFEAAIVDSHNLVPKLIPQIVTGIKMTGDKATGLFKRTEFTDLIPFTYTLDRIDELDEENYVFKYWLLEGGRLGKLYGAAEFVIKIEPKIDGGCIFRADGAYHAYDDVDFTEEDLMVGKQGLTAMYIAVEAYLIANPNAYV